MEFVRSGLRYDETYQSAIGRASCYAGSIGDAGILTFAHVELVPKS